MTESPGMRPSSVPTPPQSTSSSKPKPKSESQARIQARAKKHLRKKADTPATSPCTGSLQAIFCSGSSETAREEEVQGQTPGPKHVHEQYNLPPLVHPDVPYEQLFPYVLPNPQPYPPGQTTSPVQGRFTDYVPPWFLATGYSQMQSLYEQQWHPAVSSSTLEDVTIGRTPHAQPRPGGPDEASVGPQDLSATEDCPRRGNMYGATFPYRSPPPARPSSQLVHNTAPATVVYRHRPYISGCPSLQDAGLDDPVGAPTAGHGDWDPRLRFPALVVVDGPVFDTVCFALRDIVPRR
ncbi:unnamed protein product [Diplocarpon coronariae]